MEIVITDGFTLNPGDLSWKPLKEIGTVSCYERTSPDEVLPRCRNASVIVTNKTPINEKVIEAAQQLRMIAVTATGFNIIDVDAARRRGVLVCNVPEYGTYSVAQHAFSLLVELTNHVGIHSRSVLEGDWVKSVDWSYVKKPIIELKDKILGIVGLGRIGNRTALIGQAFGMNVIFHRGKPNQVKATGVSLEELFAESDFISLHCPLTKDNAGFVNKRILSLARPSAFLINTSRGQLIDEHDLALALENNKLAGAGLDGLSKEPPPHDHPLLHARNCIITPHNAWLSLEARKRILEVTIGNIHSFLSGKPQNQVNG